MASLPTISIVIPTLNQGRFIAEAIESLLVQDYPALEVVVIDGGSGDGTLDVIRRFESRLSYWESAEDEGQSHAINKGFARSSGEIVNWLNSDDRLEPGALQEIGRLAIRHPEKALFLGRTRVFDEAGTIRVSGQILFGDDETTIGFGQVSQPAMFYRRSVLGAIGPLDQRLHMCMDLHLWLKFLLFAGVGQVASSDSVWAAFRLHSSSKTMSAGAAFEREKMIVYRSLFKHLGLDVDPGLLPPASILLSYPPAARIRRERCLSAYLLWRADALRLDGNSSEARRLFCRVRPGTLARAQLRRYLAVAARLWGPGRNDAAGPS